MLRTLLVTNDFPPRPGGIQSYLYELASRLPADRLVVYAPSWSGAAGGHEEFDAAQPFRVVRHPGTLMLPTPGVLRRARDILRAEGCEAVWFGAAAPLGLLGPALRRAGARRIVACTHGHEVGWSMLPGARGVLRRIGESADVVTYVSKYTRSRFASAFGPMTALSALPSGVDAETFRPDAEAGAAVRKHYGLGDRPVVVCVSRLVPRKGQDVLVRALPRIREHVADAALLLVGGGPYREQLRALAERNGVNDHVITTGSVPWDGLPAHFNAGNVFAMPCRTRGGGLDVEGLGIVFLEASATGIPVVAGRSGGAPEAVREGETGHVVDGRSMTEVADVVSGLLVAPADRQELGAAGRAWVRDGWRWQDMADRLAGMLDEPAAR